MLKRKRISLLLDRKLCMHKLNGAVDTDKPNDYPDDVKCDVECSIVCCSIASFEWWMLRRTLVAAEFSPFLSISIKMIVNDCYNCLCGIWLAHTLERFQLQSDLDWNIFKPNPSHFIKNRNHRRHSQLMKRANCQPIEPIEPIRRNASKPSAQLRRWYCIRNERVSMFVCLCVCEFTVVPCETTIYFQFVLNSIAKQNEGQIRAWIKSTLISDRHRCQSHCENIIICRKIYWTSSSFRISFILLMSSYSSLTRLPMRNTYITSNHYYNDDNKTNC